MRAFQLNDYTGPDGLALVEIDPPEAGAGEVLIDVEAIGVNFPDLLMIRGQYQHKPALPVVPGCEVAGTVTSSPPGSGWEVGDRVAAFIWQGGFAERAAVPLSSLVRVPDGVDMESAAAMVVNYHTVHFGLSRRGGTRPGETVLVMGAGGGIGTAALQVAEGLGARVIAGVADTTQVVTAQSAGASQVLVLEAGFSQKLREMTEGRGVDVVLDPLGDWLFDEALRGLAPEGRVLVIGFAAGKIPAVKLNRLLLRNVSVVGVAFGAFLGLDPALMGQQAESLDRMVADGVVRPQIGARFAFEQLPEALHRLGRGGIPGKGVVAVSG